MKKITFLIILGCLSLCGYSINPIDPVAKSGDNVITIKPTTPVTTEECSDLLSLVNVTVIVTFTDCPDYDCEYKTCTFNVCIYDGLTLLQCTLFNPDSCTYTFEGLRAEEGHTLSSHLEIANPPCTANYNNGFDGATNVVPTGGGIVYINTTYCL